MKRLVVLLALSLPVCATAGQELDRWLEAQTSILYWQADVVQVRELKGLARPLRAPGRAWVAQPDKMRWELGNPPRTIAIRQGDELIVNYPLLQETERYALSGEVNPAGRQALALLQAGFPADSRTFYENYEFIQSRQVGDRWLFDLKPRSESSRRLLDAVQLEVEAESWRLMATEFRFPDGSKMRNEFSAHQIGMEPQAGLFQLEPEPKAQP